jgi:hypothetical protein
MSEDDILFWQDHLDIIMGGRTELPKCPFCHKGAVRVEHKERSTRLECTNKDCRHFIEGQFPDHFERHAPEAVAAQKALPADDKTK